MSLFYFDLETIPADDTITDQDLISAVPSQYKKKESIEGYIKKNKEQITEKIIKERSTDFFKCQVICVSYSFDERGISSVFGDDEKTVLTNLQDEIQKFLDEIGYSYTALQLVGHNIRKFDCPILYLRACKYRLTMLQQLLQFSAISDTMEEAVFRTYGKYVSLEGVCKYFGIPTPKGDMDGSKVYPAYKDGNLKKIVEYCEGDVGANIAAHKMFKI